MIFVHFGLGIDQFIGHVNSVKNQMIAMYSRVPNTRRGLDKRGRGWEPLKETIKRGVLIIGGSEIRKKRGFTLSTGDKCILYA